MISCEEGGELEVWGFGGLGVWVFLDILVAATVLGPLDGGMDFARDGGPYLCVVGFWVNARL